jgi:Na+/H+ antiporter NhaD/arsenite permease-like protein
MGEGRVRRVAGGLIAGALALAWSTRAEAAGLDGAAIHPLLTLPFLGILLSIALLPQISPSFWEHHLGKLAAAWAVAALAPLLVTQGLGPTAGALLHTLLLEYVPFVLLLLALFTISGGIVVAGNLHGSPAVNTGLLAIGTLLASFIGTTGASMVLIRPLIRANDERRRNAHVVVFFIFLVSNIGGSLTPLGDPPLFLGFLRGVDFFWTTSVLLHETLFAAAVLLALFFALDTVMYRRDSGALTRPDPSPDSPLRVRGAVNLLLLAILIAIIVASGIWKPAMGFSVFGVRLELQNLVRDGAMLMLVLASLALTSRRNRAANDFQWLPILEVAKIFAGIFVCIIPVAAALQSGAKGIFAPLLALVSHPDGTPDNVAYFWLSGLLSSFLDNAPTYLVFFELAGADPARLMGPLAGTLTAISLGAVYMGANTYIGNAPNFMVFAIARSAGIRMPGFLGYMLWSGAILLPLFGLITLLFIR